MRYDNAYGRREGKTSRLQEGTQQLSFGQPKGQASSLDCDAGCETREHVSRDHNQGPLDFRIVDLQQRLYQTKLAMSPCGRSRIKPTVSERSTGPQLGSIQRRVRVSSVANSLFAA